MSKLEQLGQGPYFIKCMNSGLHRSILKFKLNQDVIIFGRSRDSDVYITDDNISKSHGVLLKISAAWYLTDFDSTNGVFVNHQQLISKTPYRLVEGDIFSLGPSEYISFIFGSYNIKDGKSSVISANSSLEALNSSSAHISQIAKLHDKIVQLESELALNKSFKDDSESLKMGVQMLKDELQSKTELLEIHLSQAVKDRDVIEDLRKVISHLEEKYKAKVQIEANLNQRNGELVKKNGNFQKEIEKVKQLQEMNLLNHETIAFLRIESESHQNKVCDANEEIKRLKTEIEKLMSECNISNEGLRNTTLLVQEKESELQRLRNEYQSAVSENKALSVEISKMELKITQRNENLIRENKALIFKNKNLSSQITELNKKVLSLSQGQFVGNDQDLGDMQNHVNLVMENELNCSICSEFFVNAVTLGCSHVFCLFCITSWKKKKLDCPTCRKAITTESLSPVIDNFINKMVLYLPNEIKIQRDKITEERAPKIPTHQQAQRKMQFQPQGQLLQPNAWRQVPSRHPATQVPSRHPAMQVPSRHPATQVPSRHPATQVPAHHPATQVPSRNPATQAPSRQFNSRAPRGANFYNAPPRLQRQNYGNYEQPTNDNYAHYDLEFF